MSDNFGSGQPRVLSTEDRSLDNIVFQYKTPPLSSEWNLINQIGNQKIKDAVSSFTPSGWVQVGDVKSLEDMSVSETNASVGDIFTSLTYSANTFKLMSNDTGATAVVNGWPICIAGYNSTGTDNIIELDAPTADSYRYDFVFLEVWKKLTGENDPIYPHGNVTATPYTDNELVYDVVGVETTKRVQIQYRIRTQKITSISNFNEGFDLTSIYPIGGRTSAYQFPSYKFRVKGSDDVGLYISGSGSSADQTILNTVDGYVYAIPMFMVYRRKQGSFNTGAIHSSATTRQSYLSGYRSDRPDGKLLDVIYKSDIVDYRHRILVNASQSKDIMENTFKKLVTGGVSTNIGKGFTNFSGGKAIYSGASKQFKIEQINGAGGNDIPNLSSGESSTSYFKRSVYANAAISTSFNIVSIPVAASGGSTWSAGTFDLSSYIPSTSLVTITTAQGIYEPSLGEVTLSSYSTSNKEITISEGSNIIGTSSTIYLEVDLTYIAGNNGLRNVPEKIFEVNKSIKNPISASGVPVSLRYNLTGIAVCYGSNGKDINDGETDSRDFIQNAHNSFTETVDFGMDLLIHRPIGVVPSQFTINLTESKLYGYYILGVKSVYENVGTTASPDWVLRTFNHIRDEVAVTPSNPDEKEITAYRLSINSVANTGAKEFKITLVVGSKPDYYKVATQQIVKDEINALKFFKFNRQARGIIDIFEMIEVVAERDGSTDFFIADTVDKPIIKIATKATSSSDAEGTYLTGVPYVYDSSGNVFDSIKVAGTAQINSILPILTSDAYSTQKTPTRIKVQDTSSSITGNYIKVPLLVKSYVSSNEQPYNFNYEFIPYQGLLSPTSVVSGEFLSSTQANISSKGSGRESSIVIGTDSLIGGKAKFIVSSRFVQPISDGSGVPDWTSYLDLDNYTYFIRIKNDATSFKIEKFASGVGRTGWVVLNQPFRQDLVAPSSAGDEYEIIREDVPSDNVSNTIDRMPTFLYEDYKGESTLMTVSGVSSSFIYTDAVNYIQDPLKATPGTFVIGSASNLNNQTSRGVSDIILSSDPNDSNFQLSFKRPSIQYTTVSTSGTIYKKVFQPYLYLKIDSNGVTKPYMAVISSESKNDTVETKINNYTDKDTIDLFELIGRPLIKL